MKVAFVMNADFQKDAEGQLNLNAVRHNGFQNGGGNHLEMYFKFMVMVMAAATKRKGCIVGDENIYKKLEVKTKMTDKYDKEEA